MKKSVTIPHLTGGNNNKVVQVIEWMQALGNPVFTDSKGNHLPHQQIVELYDEAISPSDNKPIVKVFYETNETEYVRNNPAKPGKRKTAARDKYMANLLGGKDGNDLLNLASKVGSRKAAVEILKSGSTKTPFDVEMPLSDEDEIGSLKMQGLTPSVNALVDEGFRAKLQSDIRGLLGEENVDEKLAELDKGVLITDEGIEDFRQMLTVYHLSHQMNGPLANSIKGHVPRKHADLFDRLIPTFDDILAGENLVLFANSIKTHPESRNTNFPLMEESDTLLPSWLQLALPSDDALRELKENLGEREVESALQTLASGDFMGSFYKVLSSVRTTLAWPLVTLLRGLGGTSRQDDRQARLFDDLNENITDALVSDYGRGRGYTNRKELAKAVMFSASEAYDRRLTELFSPLKITINAARRVRSFSKSGVKLELTVDLNTFDAGDVKGTPAMAVLNPGMFYIGNFDFRIPPIGWNRKWMNGTAQIIHEYWDYIRPSGNVAANAAFMPVSDDRSLSLPQILYLIAIRTKEIYNYDLSPEEWVTLIKVLGGKNALTENYYSSSNSDLMSGIDELIAAQEKQIIDNRETMRALTTENALLRARRNPSGNSSALPQVYYDNLFDMATLMKNRQKALASQQKETQKFFDDLKEFNKNKKDKIADLNKKKKTIDAVMTSWKKEEEKARGWHERAKELEAQIKPLKVFQDRMEALKVLGGEAEPISNIWSRKQLEFILQNSEILHQKGQPAFIQEMNLEEEWRAAGKMSKQQTHDWLVKTLLGEETDSKAADVLLELVEEVEEEKLASEIITIENNLEDILEDSGNADALEILAEVETFLSKKGVLPELPSDAEVAEAIDDLAVDEDDIGEGIHHTALPWPKPDFSKMEKRKLIWWFRHNLGYKPPHNSSRPAIVKLINKAYANEQREKDPDATKPSDISSGEGDWSDPRNPPTPENPVLNLGDRGQIVIIGDTHADYKTNQIVIKHIKKNYPEAKVVWNGDKVDGRHRSYKPIVDDEINLKIINDLIKSNPHKYFTTQGNHERAAFLNPIKFYEKGTDGTTNGLYNNTGGYWGDMSEEKSLETEKRFAKQPIIAHAGPAIIVHGGLPKNFKRGWLNPKHKPKWAKRRNINEILWKRPRMNDTEQQEVALSAGFSVLITGHTPHISYCYLRNKPFIENNDFLAISNQTTSYYDVSYTVLDLDKKKAIVETFVAGVRIGGVPSHPLKHESTYQHAFPRTSTVDTKNTGIEKRTTTSKKKAEEMGISHLLCNGCGAYHDKRLECPHRVMNTQQDLDEELRRASISNNNRTQIIANPPFDMGKPYKGTSIQERLLLWASMHIDPYYEGRYTGMDDSHSNVSYPTDIQKYKPMYGTKEKLFSIEKIKHSKDTNVRYFSATNVNSEGSSIIGSFEDIVNQKAEDRSSAKQMRNIEEFLSSAYKAKVDIGYFDKNDWEDVVLIVRIEQNLPNPQKKKKKSPRKNQPEKLLCIYKKSSRSKPCGSPLREKKNPKGRYACRKCGAEYEMR